MATYVFNIAKAALFGQTTTPSGTPILDVGTSTIKAMLVMTNFGHTAGADADKDHDSLATMTLDEFDGSGYTAGGYTLASKTIAADDTNNYAVFDAADVSAGALGAGTRAVEGILIYKDAATDVPIAFLDLSSNYTANGATVTIQWSANGICRIT